MLSRRRIGARAKGREKKKSNNGSSLPYDGSSRELGFVPCQRSVATFHKKKKKRKKKKERKRKKRKEITKKKERRRNNNNGISNCMLRAACDCVSVFLFFFFFFGKEDNEYIFETVLLTHLGSKMTGPVFSDFFFLLFTFVLFILFNYSPFCDTCSLKVFFFHRSFLFFNSYSFFSIFI